MYICMYVYIYIRIYIFMYMYTICKQLSRSAHHWTGCKTRRRHGMGTQRQHPT